MSLEIKGSQILNVEGLLYQVDSFTGLINQRLDILRAFGVFNYERRKWTRTRSGSTEASWYHTRKHDAGTVNRLFFAVSTLRRFQHGLRLRSVQSLACLILNMGFTLL